ncbi:branched-chain amino acid transporter AzlD [Agreia sp. Leaf335]|uniref:AzlD domain-containing protein n=1 Tax=Agreia sp. Leaf335 TaxID=1736340 RepID=UPI0006FB5007|nr:AzlD domain-containing protein [Agreia sp. Leaf335]KQR22140.1 branched-chain amino acid transporter AzlD [Agreia sp. Leaf335]
MTAWHIVLLASIICFGLKSLGYLVPARLIERPTPARMVDLLTVALLAALISLQTFAQGQQLQLDARVPAVLVAAVLFALRVPFIVVVVAAAAVAAGIRALS